MTRHDLVLARCKIKRPIFTAIVGRGVRPSRRALPQRQHLNGYSPERFAVGIEYTSRDGSGSQKREPDVGRIFRRLHSNGLAFVLGSRHVPCSLDCDLVCAWLKIAKGKRTGRGSACADTCVAGTRSLVTPQNDEDLRYHVPAGRGRRCLYGW